MTRCTHVTYSFVGLNEDGSVRILDNYHAVVRNGLSRFVALRQKNPNLKVLVSMGGWNEGSERYSLVVNDRSKRARLVTSVYEFILKYGFDGFDFDWEYPATRGGAASDYVWCTQDCHQKQFHIGLFSRSLTSPFCVSCANVSAPINS